MKQLLPLTIEKYKNDTFQILDTNGKVVGFHLTKDEAEFIIMACNSHPELVKTNNLALKAIENFLGVYDIPEYAHPLILSAIDRLTDVIDHLKKVLGD